MLAKCKLFMSYKTYVILLIKSRQTCLLATVRVELTDDFTSKYPKYRCNTIIGINKGTRQKILLPSILISRLICLPENEFLLEIIHGSYTFVKYEWSTLFFVKHLSREIANYMILIRNISLVVRNGIQYENASHIKNPHPPYF